MSTQNEFAAANLTMGQLNAIVKKLGGHEKALAFLRGEITVSEPIRSWREQDGVIYFTVTSNGKTGQEWLDYFKVKKTVVSNWAHDLLQSPNFQPTNGVTTEIAVLKGSLFTNDGRVTKNIRVKANKYGLFKPNAEVACLIRDMFTDEKLKAMGLDWIVVMHELILDSIGDPDWLCALHSDGGSLGVCDNNLDRIFDRKVGFAFAVSQVSSLS